MIAQIGLLLLTIALAACLFTGVRQKNYIKYFSIIPFATTLLAFILLIIAFIISDFSLKIVYENSHTAKPLFYKIVGSFGNHEGSILLFVLFITAHNMIFDLLVNKIEPKLKYTTIQIQNLICGSLIAYILFTSNPFTSFTTNPEQGLGLNPLLQDFLLSIHPPILYLGYSGTSIILSFCLAALLTNSLSKEWAGYLLKWVLFCFASLTLGIAFGSFWAYRELGWGGFWFWDPVENVSLMPWLLVTALLHSLIVSQKRGELQHWTILLGLFSFLFSLIGIFLVRSGILTSVHSFASDPKRGIFILTIFCSVMLFSLSSYIWKFSNLKSIDKFKLISREQAVLFHNIILLTLLITIFIGTIYPILLYIFTEHQISVGAPYYNKSFNYIALLGLIVATIGPQLKWQSDKFISIISPLVTPIIITLLIVILALINFEHKISSFGYSAIGLATLVVITTLSNFAIKVNLLKKPLKEVKRNINKLSSNYYSMILGHCGLGLLAIAITVTSYLSHEGEYNIKLNQPVIIDNYKIELKNFDGIKGENFISGRGKFIISKNDKELATLLPENRFYFPSLKNTQEAAIYYTMFSNIYIVIGKGDGQHGLATKIYYKPLINLIWFAALMLTCAGILPLIRNKGGKKKS